MRLTHFEKLQPVCPVCRQQGNILAPLSLINVAREENENVIEGLLLCSNSDCRQEFPIIHGIPILLNYTKQYLKNNILLISANHQFSSLIESILGDAAGVDSEYNRSRHFISSYGWDHYADRAPSGEFEDDESTTTPGGAVACLNAGLNMLPTGAGAPMLDIGCALGRTSFELAEKFSGITLGIDVNFWKLRIAQQVLHKGIVTFPLKKLGLVYEKHEYEVGFKNSNQVDFWACNALALPFANNTFQFSSALNVFDIVPNPRKLLSNIYNVLKPEGCAVISTPYDWALPVTQENWVGGYAQFGSHGGESEYFMRQIFSTAQHKGEIENLKLLGEIEYYPWNLRVSKRHTASYDVHILACQKMG